jgi:hypothetical protein
MKHVLAAILGLALAGCALRVPVLVFAPGEEGAQQSKRASEVMNEAAVTPRFGTGAVVVTNKDGSWFNKGCPVDIALDDQLVAGLRPGEQVTLFAEPGRRIISVSTRDEAPCDVASTKFAMEIVAHTTQKVRVGPDVQDDLKVEVDPYGRELPP